jgi:F-type H+-transporting ATPase subunit alpha
VEILKQGQNQPMSVDKQVAILYCGSKGLLSKVPVESVKKFEQDFLAYLEVNHKDTLNALGKGNIDDTITGVLDKVAKEMTARYN